MAGRMSDGKVHRSIDRSVRQAHVKWYTCLYCVNVATVVAVDVRCHIVCRFGDTERSWVRWSQALCDELLRIQLWRLMTL